MALTILQGDDWTAAGDWTNGVPTDGDSAYISAGLDQDIVGVDKGGDDLALIRLPENYARDLGSSGAPLIIATAKLEHYGRGGLYYTCDSPVAENTDDVEIACSGDRASRVITELDSDATNPGDYKRILLKRGTIRVLANLTFDNTDGQVIVGKVDSDNDVTLTILAGADTCPRLSQGSGTVRSNRAITDAIVSGQSLLVQDTAAITTLDVCAGAHAILNYGGTTATAVIATTVRVWPGGTLDLRANTKLKTITTGWWFPGSTILKDDGLHTITTEYDFRRLTP